jgi:hypothetical protein
MSNSNDPNSSPQHVLVCLVLGLLAIAAVPALRLGGFRVNSTRRSCLGIALLLYAVFAYISAINGRLAALEQRLADKDRTRN